MRAVVLIVDADPSMGQRLRQELGRELDCMAASSYSGALAVVRLEPRVRAIVCDFDLGSGPGGIELLDVVRHRVPRVARILMTGTPLGIRERGDVLARRIAHRIIEKPWPPGQLRTTLRAELQVQVSGGESH